MDNKFLSNKTIFLILFFNLNLFAQVDSIKSYNLGEVKVQSSILIEPKPVMKIDNKIIQNSDAISINEISKQIPSVKIQNNSRGESQIYFRGSSTRQLTLFFDGVPLNIPWDNRIDLSLLPTNAIDNIEITKGIPSTIYGPNTISGVVNISSLKYNSKRSKQIKIMGGENYFQNYSGYWSDKFKNLDYLISISYSSTDGFNLPKSFDHLENSEKLRINSSSETLSGFAKIGYKFSNKSKMSLSFSSKSSKKNVPPEIDVSSPRYWRYPEWKHSAIILNGTHGIYNGSNLSYSLSVTKFNMQIDQYKSINYNEIDDTEYNDDLTLYGRLLYSTVLSQNSLLKFIASGLSSLHNEKFLLTGLTEIDYSLGTFSVGTEYEYFNDNLFSIIGISFDGQSTPLNGLFPAKEIISDYGANFSLLYNLSPTLSTQLNIGRKTRFPTLREMFSGALGKFIPNPELKSEISYSAETGINYSHNNTTHQIIFFLSFVTDGIVRTTISDTTFKRINESEIRNYGLEFTNKIDISNKLKLNLNLSYLNSFAKNQDGEFVDTLEYKPQFILNGNLDYNISESFETIIEANYIGEEYALKDGTEGLKKLDNYLLVNFRLLYKIPFSKYSSLEFFFRVNNIFDKLYYTQWGLPEAGRQFFIGTTLTF